MSAAFDARTAVKNLLRKTPFYGVAKDLYRRRVRAAGLFDVALLDITNGCNLRCPFCYNDWSAVGEPALMPVERFDRVVQVFGLVRNDGVAISCSFEPFLHPQFPELLARIPARYRSKGYFSTNLARPLRGGVAEALAAAPLHHINVSMESLTAATYEACRKGASFPRFHANLEALARAVAGSRRGPALHVITMLCDLNLREIPELVRRCREELGVAYHEVRPFTRTPANEAWIAAHGVTEEQWRWLRDALDSSGATHCNLLPLPRDEGSTHYMELPDTRFLRVEADGRLALGQNPRMEPELETHLDEIDDLESFLKRWIRRHRTA
ncbi:MAG TPA: radical SAM protein [Acidobacteria bacterium]|nr:radical SAM protein [Acidobacteriota bacterium]